MHRIRIIYTKDNKEKTQFIEGNKISDKNVIELISEIEKDGAIIDILVLGIEKICNKCGKSYLDIDKNFYSMKSGVDGYMSTCKHCFNEERTTERRTKPKKKKKVICAMCGQEFETYGKNQCCSENCKREKRKEYFKNYKRNKK